MSSTSSTPQQASAIAEADVVNPNKREPDGPPADGSLPAPTLAAYYGKPTLRLRDWIKAIKAIKTARLTTFADEDVETTRTSLTDLDFDLRKTLLLANEQSQPAPVRLWINTVTQRTLKDRLPNLLFDPLAPATEQISRIAEGLRVGSTSANKRDRAKDETLLQLALQLILKRHSDFDPNMLLGVLFQPLRSADKADIRLATGELRKRLLQANVRQLRDLSLVYASVQNRSIRAEQARRDAHERAEESLARLQMERDQVKTLKSELAESRTEIQALSAEVTRLNTAIHDTQQIGAHDTAAILAKMRTLLVNRIPPLLEDATDALSREPYYVDVAQERITSVRNIIKGEVAWLDESSD